MLLNNVTYLPLKIAARWRDLFTLRNALKSRVLSTLTKKDIHLSCPPCCQRNTKASRLQHRTWQTPHNDWSQYKQQQTTPFSVSRMFSPRRCIDCTPAALVKDEACDLCELRACASPCYSLYSNLLFQGHQSTVFYFYSTPYTRRMRH